jgi:preprotein translocase subunit YajC
VTDCFTSFLILAAAEGPAGPGLGAQILFLFLPIGILFYFLMIRPQQKERSRREMMLKAIKANDRVITVGGIKGVVTNVHREADEVTIRVDEANNTKLRLTLGSVARVVIEGTSDASK